VDAVGYITYANLANLNLVTQGTLLSLIEAQLMCVGAGPTLDFADASALLAKLTPGILLFALRLDQTIANGVAHETGERGQVELPHGGCSMC
jgi:hypothetical protein